MDLNILDAQNIAPTLYSCIRRILSSFSNIWDEIMFLSTNNSSPRSSRAQKMACSFLTLVLLLNPTSDALSFHRDGNIVEILPSFKQDDASWADHHDANTKQVSEELILEHDVEDAEDQEFVAPTEISVAPRVGLGIFNKRRGASAAPATSETTSNSDSGSDSAGSTAAASAAPTVDTVVGSDGKQKIRIVHQLPEGFDPHDQTTWGPALGMSEEEAEANGLPKKKPGMFATGGALDFGIMRRMRGDKGAAKAPKAPKRQPHPWDQQFVGPPPSSDMFGPSGGQNLVLKAALGHRLNPNL